MIYEVCIGGQVSGDKVSSLAKAKALTRGHAEWSVWVWDENRNIVAHTKHDHDIKFYERFSAEVYPTLHKMTKFAKQLRKSRYAK